MVKPEFSYIVENDKTTAKKKNKQNLVLHLFTLIKYNLIKTK